jgi:hypothetical protein
MVICNEGHDEIVHDAFDCPLCAVKAELSERDDTIEYLREYIAGIEGEES